MDIITLASVVQNGLIQRSRIFTVSVLLPDVPGQLNKVSKVIADVQGNVIKLEHNQFVSVNRNSSVELTITMEAFGHDHKKKIIDGLTCCWFQTKGKNNKRCLSIDSVVVKCDLNIACGIKESLYSRKSFLIVQLNS